MKRFLSLLLPAAVLCGLTIACEDAEIAKETFTAQTINGDEVLVGAVTDLMWQSYKEGDVFSYLKQKGIAESEQYCADLDWAGFTDWRLPTIDELRSIVEGYPDLERGGRCKVGKSCLEYPCKDKGAKDDNDRPCAHDEAQYTGPGPQGCYWETVWHDRFCGPHWSSSVVAGGAGERWVLTFYDPSIFVVPSTGTAFPRCVRK
ncbi:MAG TPA: DUF1566 domain-containing protein [bacterium]|nr:DUF1566 domain-containing protein [bacterium]